MSYLGATELVFPAGVSIGTNTLPYNLNTVASVIYEISAEVDGFAAAAGYEVPVTASAPEALGTIRRAVANGVQGVVLSTLFPAQQSAAGGTTPSLASTYAAAYKRFRDGIKAGDLILVGATRAGEDQGRVLPRSGGLASARITLDTRF